MCTADLVTAESFIAAAVVGQASDAGATGAKDGANHEGEATEHDGDFGPTKIELSAPVIAGDSVDAGEDGQPSAQAGAVAITASGVDGRQTVEIATTPTSTSLRAVGRASNGADPQAVIVDAAARGPQEGVRPPFAGAPARGGRFHSTPTGSAIHRRVSLDEGGRG